MNSVEGYSSICTCQQSVHTSMANGNFSSLLKSNSLGKWLPLGCTFRSIKRCKFLEPQFIQQVFFIEDKRGGDEKLNTDFVTIRSQASYDKRSECRFPLIDEDASWFRMSASL